MTQHFGMMDNNGNVVDLDDVTGALPIVDYHHHEIHEGNSFVVSHSVADIGAATSPNDAVTLTFTTPDTAKWAHMVVQFHGAGGALCRIREGGSGGGSPSGRKAAINANRNSANTSGLIDIEAVPAAGGVSYDAGLDTGGTLIFEKFLPGSVTFLNASGAEGGERHEYILKQNTRYQISMVLAESVAAGIVLYWYEHTNKV